jgi:hypothetical protein
VHSAVTNKPAYIPPGYQDQAWVDTFTTSPFAPDFKTRRQTFFEQVLRNPAPPHPSKRAMFEIARLAASGEPDENIIRQSLTEQIEARQDCADFVMQAIIRMLYQFGESASGSPGFSEKLLTHAKQATLGFKYWPDEPGLDSMCTWTENHQILFSTAAYLAGQLYPDEIFTNSGRLGREMMTIHRPRINRWLEMRFKSGFSEWLSNVYYDEDWAALLNLVDFAEDELLRARARAIIDLLLLDMALNSFQGAFGCTHGRSYEQNKKWAALEGTTDTSKLLFGTGAFSAYDNMSVAPFALSENYRMPQVLFEIANDTKRMENRQRMGHRVEDTEKWGLTYDDLESGMVFLSNEAYLHPKTASLTIKLFDAFNWWENDFFAPFKPYRGLLRILCKLKLLPPLTRLLERDVCRNTREEVNIYTYRTPDYMLSTAQDYRKGYGGDQQHIWQATLGPDAVCFTTHPAKIEGITPNYWAGSGLLPRAAQYKNLAIIIYNIKKIPALYVPIRYFFTHAWLLKDKFDEVVEKDGWIFARKDYGYLALRSQNPYVWGTYQNGDPKGFQKSLGSEGEIIADGAQNIWLCQLGRKTNDGSFEQFVDAIDSAELTFSGLDVEYRSPGIGLVRFGWKGAFSVDKVEIPMHGYPRYDNPYVQVEFDPNEIKVKAGEHELHLHWKTGERKMR